MSVFLGAASDTSTPMKISRNSPAGNRPHVDCGSLGKGVKRGRNWKVAKAQKCLPHFVRWGARGVKRKEFESAKKQPVVGTLNSILRPAEEVVNVQEQSRSYREGEEPCRTVGRIRSLFGSQHEWERCGGESIPSNISKCVCGGVKKT